MYMDARPRVPTWAECSDIGFAKALAGPSYSTGLREVVDPPALRERISAAATAAQLPPLIDPASGAAVMGYQGVWGGGDRTLVLGRSIGIGRGPVTPSVVALWRNPLTVIFCTPHWRPAGHCPK
jgi:hypothetical protein